MKEEAREGQKGKGNWLDEHDSIQDELLKMKDEFIKEKIEEDIKYPEGAKEEDDEVSGDHDIGPRSEKTEKVEREGMDETEESETAIEHREPKKPMIDDKVGFLSKERKEGDVTNIRDIPRPPPSRREARDVEGSAKLEKGKIPTAPNLSEKIANVIQLENKLKRRKFEMEKKERDSNRSSPGAPSKPEIKKKKGGHGEKEEGKENLKDEDTVDELNAIVKKQAHRRIAPQQGEGIVKKTKGVSDKGDTKPERGLDDDISDLDISIRPKEDSKGDRPASSISTAEKKKKTPTPPRKSEMPNGPDEERKGNEVSERSKKHNEQGSPKRRQPLNAQENGAVKGPESRGLQSVGTVHDTVKEGQIKSSHKKREVRSEEKVKAREMGSEGEGSGKGSTWKKLRSIFGKKKERDGHG